MCCFDEYFDVLFMKSATADLDNVNKALHILQYASHLEEKNHFYIRRRKKTYISLITYTDKLNFGIANEELYYGGKIQIGHIKPGW